jgi:hypothetical protein
LSICFVAGKFGENVEGTLAGPVNEGSAGDVVGKVAGGGANVGVGRVESCALLLGVLIVVGILLWLVNRFIPMAKSNQVNLECRRRLLHGFLARKCFWVDSLSLQDSSRALTQIAPPKRAHRVGVLPHA